MLSSILNQSRTINQRRSLVSVFRHFLGEVKELEDEIIKVHAGVPEGEDGVIGEAVDCIIMMVDAIYLKNNNVTEEQIQAVVDRKLAKWKDRYEE